MFLTILCVYPFYVFVMIIGDTSFVANALLFLQQNVNKTSVIAPPCALKKCEGMFYFYDT